MKIKIVSVTHRYPNDELLKVSEDQIQFASLLALLSELQKQNVIKFIRSEVDKNNTNVTAQIKIVVK